MTKRPSTPEPKAQAYGSGTMLAVVCVGPLLALTAFTTPVANLTGTAAALGAGSGAQAWIMSAMPVGTGAAVLGSGAIGDDYGRRATFFAGAFLLAIASLLGALAPTPIFLIAARILQGVGSAGIFSCGLGLIGKMYPSGHERARATAVWAAALGGGVALGPLLSAGLTNLAGWRAPYVFIAFACVALALLARLVLPEVRAERPRPVDVAGTILLGVGIAAFLSGLVEIRGGRIELSVALLAAGVALGAVFVVVEKRVRAPMLDLGLFRRPDFVGATVAALAGGAGVLSLVSFLPTLLERAMQMAPIGAATMLLAWSATSVASAFAVRWLPASVGARPLLIAGVAYGILNSALGRQAVESVPTERAAMGRGANNTARYLGSATGLTVVTVIVTHGSTDGMLGAWSLAVLLTSACSLLGTAVVMLSKGRPAG